MTPAIIPFDKGQKNLNWLALVDAIKVGHTLPKAEIEDLFLYRGSDTLLSRSAWIDGMGLLTKTATVFPENKKTGTPMVGGGVMLFDDTNGALEAMIDFHLITKWKTAADSLMAALALAPSWRPQNFDCRCRHRGPVSGRGFWGGFSERKIQYLEPKRGGCGDICNRNRSPDRTGSRSGGAGR